MREELNLRLQRVMKRLALVHRLRRVALSEDGLVDRVSDRSKKVLLDVKGKFTRAAKQIDPSLDDRTRAVMTQLLQEISRVVTADGTVDHSALETVKGDLANTWKTVSHSSRGNMSLTHFFNAMDKFLTVAMIASLLQNPRMVGRAKSEPKVREKLYSVLDQMAQVVPQVQTSLQKAVTSLPKPEAPTAAEQKTDSSAEESVKQQLVEAEAEMRAVVTQLSKVLVRKAEELFGIGSDMADSVDENIFALYNKQRVNPQLNRNRNFYADALHMEHSPTKIDLGDFLDTKEKKAIYLCYRSFVMAARALGVVQHAKATPELVLKSPKLQELVVKAQKILVHRKDKIVKYLKVLRKPSKEVKDKDRGIPKGTFSDHFDRTDKPAVAV